MKFIVVIFKNASSEFSWNGRSSRTNIKR